MKTFNYFITLILFTIYKIYRVSEQKAKALNVITILNYFEMNLKKRLLLRCIHHFKSDWINEMDHMRISGTEPSSVILSQRRYIKKLKMYAQKFPNQVKPKGMV